jgi:hypothetical protein
MKEKKVDWNKASKKDVEDEFYRLAESVRTQGDIDCILDLVPIYAKRQFIKDWHNEDEGDDE